MKKINLLLILVILASISFATSVKQDDKKKIQPPPNNATPQLKNGEKRDSTKHLKKLPLPNTSTK